MSDHKYFKKPPSKARGGNPRDLAPIRWKYDPLNSEYAPRQNALVAPSVGIFESPYGCVKINKQWLSHVAGMIAVLLELDAWQGNDDGYVARQEIYKLLAALEDDCEDIPMPCCEDLIIEVQQVRNEVTNIRNTVNYYNTDTTTILNDYSQLINTYNNSVDVVIDIAPNNKVPSGTGDKALCAAISLYVDSYCEYSRNVLSAGQSGFQIAGLVIAGAAAFFTAGGSIALWLAISGGIAAGGTVVLGLPIAVSTDQSARDEVKCCLFDFMQGKEPTKQVFIDAHNNDCELSTNASLIMSAVRYISTTDETHASFLEKLNEQYPFAELGLTGDCSSCNDPVTLYWKSFLGETNGQPNTNVAQVSDTIWDVTLAQGLNTGGADAFISIDGIGLSVPMPVSISWQAIAGDMTNLQWEHQAPLTYSDATTGSIPSGKLTLGITLPFGASQRAWRLTFNQPVNLVDV